MLSLEHWYFQGPLGIIKVYYFQKQLDSGGYEQAAAVAFVG
jgi:hypothetical protein